MDSLQLKLCDIQGRLFAMKRNYMMFHTMDPELAIEDLIEIKRQKK